jgi:aspartate racemase
LASAEFVRTVYRCRAQDVEQERPRIILLSDPTFPDRTDCLLRGEAMALAARLEDSLNALTTLGATRLVVCCVTVHAVNDALPATLRRSLLSLVDLAIAGVTSVSSPHLMLCTAGCRAAGVFQGHADWGRAADDVIWPEPEDQEAVHGLIYALKRGARAADHVDTVCGLMERYGVTRYIAGCTELHLLADAIEAVAGRAYDDVCLDPLRLAAREMAGLARAGRMEPSHTIAIDGNQDAACTLSMTRRASSTNNPGDSRRPLPAMESGGQWR